MDTIEEQEPIEDLLDIKGAERRHEGWDIRNIFRNYFFLAGAQIGSAVFSFLIVWFATRHFGTEGYGSIVALLAASQVVLVFINWTNVALSRYGVEEFVKTGKISEFFINRFFILLPNLALILVTSPLWLNPILDWLKLDAKAFPFIIVHFIVTALWLHAQNGLQAAKLLRLQGLLILLERVVILGALGLITFTGNHSWLIAVIAYISAASCMIVVGMYKLWPYLHFRVRIQRKVLRRILAFSIPLFPYTLTSFFSTNYLDVFFISKYLDKTDLGIYAVVYQVSGVLMQFPVLVGALLMPLFVTLITKNRKNVIVTYIQDVLPVVTLMWCVLAACCATFCCIVLPIIFGHDLDNAGNIIWTLVVGSTLALPSLVGYSPFMTASEAVYISFPMALVTAGSNVIGNIFLIPHWGLIGSAWATAISYGMSLFFIVWLIHRKFKLVHTWLFIATLPAIASIVWFSWRNQLWESLGIAVSGSLIIFLLYRKTIFQTTRTLFSFRNSFK